jgi:hypothetical protein
MHRALPFSVVVTPTIGILQGGADAVRRFKGKRPSGIAEPRIGSPVKTLPVTVEGIDLAAEL